MMMQFLTQFLTQYFPLRFQNPEMFLLAIPLWMGYRRWGQARGVTGALRLTLLALLLLVLTGPQWRLGGRGMDAIVVVDRSRSMPAGAPARIKELIDTLQKGRNQGDRVAVVTFGSQPEVEQILSHEAKFGQYEKPILPDGSNLNEALQTALNLVDPERPARILVFSDGESNGMSPTSAARRARELKVPIDYRIFERQRSGDTAIESVLVPETVAPREPFQFSVWVYSNRDTEGTITLSRDDRIIATQTRHLSTGANQILFRDVLERGGLSQYEVRLEVPDDPLPENNRGAAVVRVEAGPRLLVLNADGQEDNLVRALRAGKLPVEIAAAAQFPMTPEELDRYRCVVLENVPASDLGRVRMERLAEFVEDQGGGLLITGGERSFGSGGYFKSPLDDVLPVSMEMREEHRKTRMAMAVVLDRSGSMSITVKGGRTKMDLADLGTAECVRMLSPGDSVAVIAVDSAPHVIQALTPVDNPEPIAKKALGIQSQGGGIFIYDALVAAGEQLISAEQSTKHIILFSDAADSEQPGDYANLMTKFAAAGITTSVIGLGTNADVDAKLLEDIAKRGSGNIMFTTDPEELPRLFTEDTMSVARSSFLQKDPAKQPNGISGEILPDARLMGELASGGFPGVDGYNLSYLKPSATMAVVSQDEYAAPFAAFWYRGLGRAAAITFEVDGKNTGAFRNWEEASDFLITHARWLLGSTDPDAAFLTVERDGQDAVVTLELDPKRPRKAGIESPDLIVAQPGAERETPLRIPFEWQGAHTLEARFRLSRIGNYLPLVRLENRELIKGPPVTLPYSPEYVPRIGLPSGEELLKSLAELTEGKPRINPLEVLADPPRTRQVQSLLPYLFLAAVCCLLLEIAGRRLVLWPQVAEILRRIRPQRVAVATARSAPTEAAPVARRPARWFKPAEKPSPSAAPPAASLESPPVETASPPPMTANDVFQAAKRRAQRRS